MFVKKEISLIKILVLAVLALGVFLPTTFLEAQGNPGPETNSSNPANDLSPPQLNAKTRVATPADGFNSVGLGCTTSINPGNWPRMVLTCTGEISMKLSSSVLYISSQIFDALLFYSLNLGPIKDGIENGQEGFINSIWTNIRDLANLGFIVGLVYVSFSLILGDYMRGPDWKKMITKLIIVAVLLNFSLLFSKLIIDVGSVMTLPFYNALNGPPMDSGLLSSVGVDLQGERATSVGGGIMSLYNPTRLLGAESFQTFANELGSGYNWIYMSLLFFTFAVMMSITAFELFMASFFFLSRIVWLIVLMIVSPLAMVSMFLPVVAGRNYFSKWLGMMFQKSFCLLPYVAGLWFLFIVTDAIKGEPQSEFGLYEGIMIVGIQFLLVFVILRAMRKQVTNMCDGTKWTESVINNVKGVAGAGLMLGTGGAGVVARSTVGRAGQQIARSETFAKMAGSKNVLSRTLGSTMLFQGDKIANAKFGSKEGYRDALNKEAKVRQDRAEQIKTITGGSKDKSISSRSVEFGEQYLKSKTGPFAIVDFISARGTAASKEALEKYQESSKQQKDKKELQKILQDEQVGIADSMQDKKNSMDNAATSAIGAFTNRVIEDLKGGKDTSINDLVVMAEGGTLATEIFESHETIKTENGDLIVDENERITTAPTVQGVKEANKRILELKANITNRVLSGIKKQYEKEVKELGKLGTRVSDLDAEIEKESANVKEREAFIADVAGKNITQEQAEQAAKFGFSTSEDQNGIMLDVVDSRDSVSRLKSNLNALETRKDVAVRDAKQAEVDLGNKIRAKFESEINDVKKRSNARYNSIERTSREMITPRLEGAIEEKRAANDALNQAREFYQRDPWDTDADDVKMTRVAIDSLVNDREDQVKDLIAKFQDGLETVNRNVPKAPAKDKK